MGKGAQRANERAIQEATDRQLRETRARLEEQRGILDQQKAAYTEFEFENPFAENVFEDLEVSQEDIRLQQEMGRQRDANILGQLGQAAGSSGIAGLATALSRQGRLRDRQASVDFSKRLEQARQAEAKGEMLRQQGEAAVQQAEFGREATLLAAEYNMMAGAEAGVQSAMANEMAGFSAISQMQSARMGMYGSIVGGFLGGVGSGLGGGLAKELLGN
tara:strand:- start:3176 stop:3829 length:654 start_codon:yes stop_codon:yes gene_type:complete